MRLSKSRSDNYKSISKKYQRYNYLIDSFVLFSIIKMYIFTIFPIECLRYIFLDVADRIYRRGNASEVIISICP